MDRRVPFFVFAGVVCFLLILVAPAEFRGLAAGVGGVYLVLALLSFLDDRGRSQLDPDDVQASFTSRPPSRGGDERRRS